jgi:hypothetical protein
MSDTDILKEAQEAFAECEERERENRKAAEDDIRFARLEEQWDATVRADREREGRPCLTINKLAPVIRQVVNDSRQNKPAIKVLPQDSKADPETAEIYTGLIRNIETSSDADIAYDTAVDSAVTCGMGYFRINLRYACDDNWEQDIVFDRVADPFAVYGDPNSTTADGSDWNVAFVSEMMAKKAFQKQFKGAAEVDWTANDFPHHWEEGDKIRVAEYWTREEIKRKIVLLSAPMVQDGPLVIDLKEYEKNKAFFDAAGITLEGPPREVMSHKVTQRLLTGTEVIQKTDWAGRYIPIVPVYGDEINLGGKRYLRSLIRSAKDSQKMFNYWSTTMTEVVALAPKAPWVGPVGSFETDQAKWETANKASHATLEYDNKGQAPMRQPFAGVPAGAMQEAMNASDNIKAVTGIYDASLGAKSNETSGRAIMARQREGDVSTFHFIDNLSRSIRHGGRILIDLIPKIYTQDRIVRVLGEDGAATTVPLGQPTKTKEGKERVYDLSVGKYDLAVKAGPSFTTRREEAAQQMIELIRAHPAAAPVIGDKLVSFLDLPGGDEIAERLKKMLPPQLQEGGEGEQGGIPPQVQQMIQQGQQALQEQGVQIQELEAQLQKAELNTQIKSAELAIKEQELGIKQFEAETDRMRLEIELRQPAELPSGQSEQEAA